MNKISNSPQLSGYVGTYVNLTVDGITKKYYVRKANKSTLLNNLQFLQDSQIENIESSNVQDCQFCDNPELDSVYCLYIGDSCGDFSSFDDGFGGLASAVSPKKHEIYINGNYAGEFALNHIDTCSAFDEGATLLTNFRGDSVYMRRFNEIDPIRAILFVFSDNKNLVFNQEDITPPYITAGGERTLRVFVNPSFLLSGTNTITIKTLKTLWPHNQNGSYYGRFPSPFLEYFFKYDENNILKCQEIRQCDPLGDVGLCSDLQDLDRFYVGYSWQFTFNGNEYVPCFVAPTTTPAPTTTVSPTTLAPTTTPPTTVLPTTVPPTTTPPSTMVPSTIIPTTIIPTTVPPTTTPPSTSPPTTSPPSTVLPTTFPPSTVPPSTMVPSTSPPSTSPPSTSPPSTSPPGTSTIP